MLLTLHIENFALIDRLELTFGSGLNVLTGETGAGKSIILDAISAALGGRMSSKSVRTGSERALIEASFDLNSRLKDWLASQEIDSLDGELVCSREISERSSRSRINGILVNRQQMQELHNLLVEITAQGQTVQLLQGARVRDWLDDFGGAPLLKQRTKVAEAHAALVKAQQALEQRLTSERQRIQQLDILEYQVKELAQAHLKDPKELEDLEQERHRLSHSVELQQQSYTIYQALYQNEDSTTLACADLLGNAEATLSQLLSYDPGLGPILELVSSALAQVEEAGRLINAYGEDLETDPRRLEQVEQRVSELKVLCRKYGSTLAEVIEYEQRICAELSQLNDAGASLEALEEAVQQQQSTLTAACTKLTQLRKLAARNLEGRLIQELKPLAMDKVQFQVELTPVTPTAYGAERVQFLFSPNPGEPLQPLSETASGGEMSRFLLALKACFSQVDPVDTLIFDEIDVGVSGRVAQAIAEKLHQLGQHHQVLCVTHQPIVAAMADTHFRVDKRQIPEISPIKEKGEKGRKTKAVKTSERTVVRVGQLEPEQRREELAQLAGGTSAQEALALADALLSQSHHNRQATAKAQ
ncbi:DNA repair protein RecN [Leptolyngbya sp. FACHB-261]|uniref:DNA repair protein RecN n=1 Tax=Leptolyngbya sp. FACHB-261 TaxID=2692806 RepID=UPI00168255D3|nr:DNA repair protein RecN [Leptolyngbya sp. FACHB-261]MBD2099288.1 DNA repair protein RecN [Leptolyngbya sp. FACHB-261]